MLDPVADILDGFDAALEWLTEDDPLLAPPAPLPADAAAATPLTPMLGPA